MMVSSVAGALQLSLGTQFVRYRASSINFDNNAGKLSVSGLKWGFGDSSPILLEGGYGITDRLLIGGILQLGGSSDTTERDVDGAKAELSEFDLMLAPKIDYQFSPTSKINPFVGGMLGIAHTSGSENGTKNSSTLFVMQARGGLRCFLAEGFSVDPAVIVGFGVGGGSAGEAGFGTTAFQIGLALSVSGWLR
jgi:hypothetical protein